MTSTAQRAFSGGILSPGMYPRRDIPKWMLGVKDAENIILLAQGGAANRGGTILAGGYDTSLGGYPQWLVPFEASVVDTYMLEFGDLVVRVIKNGAYVLNTAIAGQSVLSVTAATPARLEMASGAAAALFTVGKLVYLTDPNGTSSLSGAVLEVTVITAEFITFKIVGGVTIDTTATDWGTIGGSALLYEIYEIASPFAIEDMPLVQHVQDVDTMVMAHDGYTTQKLVRTADDNWAFSALTFVPEIDAPTGPAAVASTGSGATTYKYKIAAVNGETGEEGLPSAEASCTNDLTIAGSINTITWNTVTGADYYRVYKSFNGIFGYIGITEALTFDDENITPNTADNPQTGRDPFSGASDKPAVTAFVQQRLVLASSLNNPQAAELSASTTPFNFNRALTPGASDAISFRIRSQQLNRIVHVIDATKPLIFTTGEERYMKTEQDAPIAPGNFAVTPKTYRGSARTPRPVVVGEVVLHVTRDGNTIREFSLDVERANASADVTILARHLFRSKTITSMAYQQAPDSTVWVTFSDGSLMSMTYLQEHEIWGWTKHRFGGTAAKVKQVAVISEGAFDTPYFVVERTLFGQTVTLVEKLDTRVFAAVEDCHFVDAGFHYDGASTDDLRGFLHLRGEPVAVLADGNVLEAVTITDQGVMVTPAAFHTKISVGLAYEAYFVTLDADFGDQVENLGSTIGRLISADEVGVKVVDTRGIAVGLEGGFLNEVKEFSGVTPIPLRTETLMIDIEGDWARDIAIEVRQIHPLPMTVTAIAPDWEIGG